MGKLSRMRFTFAVLLAVSAVVAATGICMDFHIGLLERRLMKNLHIYCGYAMIIVVLIHIIDNRGWIKNIFK